MKNITTSVGCNKRSALHRMFESDEHLAHYGCA
jgi:hypothetical protein